MTEDEFNALSKEERRAVLREIFHAKKRAKIEAVERRIKEKTPSTSTG